MINITDVTKIDFDESTVKQFFRNGNDLNMLLENVCYGGDFHIVTLILKNVSSIKTDAKVEGENFMAAEDGEVVFLELESNSTKFVIEWNDYQKRLFFKYGYEISFGNYDIIMDYELL